VKTDPTEVWRRPSMRKG